MYWKIIGKINKFQILLTSGDLETFYEDSTLRLTSVLNNYRINNKIPVFTKCCPWRRCLYCLSSPLAFGKITLWLKFWEMLTWKISASVDENDRRCLFASNAQPIFIAGGKGSRIKKMSGFRVWPGAIIGDGDRKRAPFLVLGLSLWYGTIFLFLEQIAPSPTAHARTCCVDFWRCSAGEMASEIPEIFNIFDPQLNTFMSVGILLKYFRRKLLQCEWSKTVEFRYVPLHITNQVVFRCFFSRTPHHSTLNFTYKWSEYFRSED